MLRLEFSGALYHITSRGDNRKAIYFEETDYCFRGNRIGLNCFQINSIKIKHNVGTSIEFKDQILKKKIKFFSFRLCHYYFLNVNLR